MNVGLPGTGIGGMFYLLSAICMPLVGAFRREGSPTRWRIVGRQFLMAVGIGAGMWVAGFLLAAMMGGMPMLASALRGGGPDARLANVLQTATLTVSLSTLGLIICGVWIASLVVREGPRPVGAFASGVPTHVAGGSSPSSKQGEESPSHVRRAKRDAA